jgi:transposase
MHTIIGIDVSKDTLDVVLIEEKGNQHRKINNDEAGYQQLQQWLVSRHVEQVHACLEATGQYGDGVAEYLYELGHLVSVVNPARIKRYGESKLHRNKTDKADAGLIAEFCLKEKPPFWKPLSPEITHLRGIVRRLDDLQRTQQQETNRLKSGERNPWVVENLQNHVAYLKEQIRAAAKAIQEFIDQTPALKAQQDLIVTIPGIGKITAAKLLAEIGDISAFENASQLAAYAGLNPRGFRSGSSVFKKTRISKQGRPFLRFILYMPALVARKHNPIVHAFCDRLEDRHLPKMAVIVAAMHKLLHLVFGILKHRIPFDPNFGAQFNFAS